MEPMNGQQLKLDDRSLNDNRKIDSVTTYDMIAAEGLLGVTHAQMETLIKRGVLIPCNTPPAGAKKFYRRFTATALEAAKPRLAEVLQPTKARVQKQAAGANADVIARLDRIESMVSMLVRELTK